MPSAARTSLIFAAPYRVELRCEPLPPVGAGELLVETVVSAISPGTEMLFYRGQTPAGMAVDSTIAGLGAAMAYPLKYGYACVGRVIACGVDVAPAWQGRRIFAFNPHESHFLTTPDGAIPVPDRLAVEQAALLPNMETAVNFVLDGAPAIGERVVVLGQGIVGLLTARLLAHFPLASLTTVDRFALRRELALRMGATASITPEEVQIARHGDADLVFELTGNPAALDLAVSLAGFDGRVVVGSWYGTKRAELDLGGHFHRNRIRLIGSQVSTVAPQLSGRWDKARRMTEAWRHLAALDLGGLITHRIPFAAAATAYDLIDRQPEQTIQVLLAYSQ